MFVERGFGENKGEAALPNTGLRRVAALGSPSFLDELYSNVE